MYVCQSMMVLAHLEQLQDLLERNADVIYGAAGGCVGLAFIILMISSPSSSWSSSYSRSSSPSPP